MKKVVLAYSGGLDTTYCAKYLTDVKQMEVHTVIVDTGGFSKQELADVEARAYQLGAKTHTTIDATEKYYAECVKYLIFGNILKNNVYPLSVSAERVFQAVSIAQKAIELKADAIAHGSTGAGNDQVRFDMIFNIMTPNIEIITPIRDMKLSRQEEIDFLISKGVNMNFEKNKYSINKGLWGTSVGGSETLTSRDYLPESAFPTQVTKSEPEKLEIEFENGEIKSVNGQVFSSKVAAIQMIQSIAAPFGIGRDIHVGDTIIGIKGRVGFEAAAPLIIIKAHHTLEKHVLTKWQLYWKEQLSNWYGNLLHEGHFLDPVMRNIETFMNDTQQNVTGKVFLSLHPYRFVVEGIESAFDLMSSKFGSYGEMNNMWSGEDVKGFAKIFGNQTKIHQMINNNSSND
jgi:argininosuccinate synthase